MTATDYQGKLETVADFLKRAHAEAKAAHLAALDRVEEAFEIGDWDAHTKAIADCNKAHELRRTLWTLYFSTF